MKHFSVLGDAEFIILRRGNHVTYDFGSIVVSSGMDAPLFFLHSFVLNANKMNKNTRAGTCQACGRPKNLDLGAVLSEFFLTFHGDAVSEELLEMFSLALGSEDMDSLTNIERSNMFFLVMELRDLIQHLEIIHLKNS